MEFLTGNRVEPLIEASETYPRLESAIRSARQLVHMAYWTIDPAWSLVSTPDQDNWSDLIYETADRGVKVRIILADFDPLLGREFHASAWRSYRKLMKLRDGLPAASRANLQIVCSRHEATVGTAIRILGQAVIQNQLSAAIEKLEALAEEKDWSAVESQLSIIPGLWPHIRVDGTALSSERLAVPTAYPAVHHEKICVVDDTTVFLGGLDINERRYDTPGHDEDLAWHDVACAVEGPAASFFAAHYRKRWNDEFSDFKDFVEEAVPPPGVDPLPLAEDLALLDEAPLTQVAVAGSARVAPLRTISRQTKSSFSRSPRIAKTEIFDAYKALIGEAEAFIYIETQYLRSQAIVDCLIERASKQSDLEIILLLPLVPENVLLTGEPDSATQYGQHLQNEALQRLDDCLKGRFGVFTLIRDGAANPDPQGDSDRLERDIIYVHSKTMVIDDRVALIGSANLNDRSMLTDTETAIAWQEEAAVRQYRLRLWQNALQEDTADWQEDLVGRWRQHAEKNARKPPAQRRGFVVPLPERARSAYAADSLFIPPELV